MTKHINKFWTQGKKVFFNFKTVFKLKVGLSSSKKVAFICFDESPLNIIKNAFYFMSKVLFVLEVFKFLSWHYDYIEKRLDKKAKVNFKIHDITDRTKSNVTAGQKAFAIHILTNISRSKGNQIKKLGQLIDYYMTNNFPENITYTKCGEKTSFRLFYKTSKLSISLAHQQYEML